MADPDDALRVIDAVDNKRKRAETKALDVSLNELADMYESHELRIRPEYQRLFRWPAAKQSQFIESLILEMPIPPIFVIEVTDGEWELIDGLQRISSYLHFRGKLDHTELDPSITHDDALRLDECDIVPELNGMGYDDLPTALQIRLKRSFLRVEVVRRETDARFRYYMFKRLNTGGEILSDQEVRNCTIRLLGDDFNNFLQRLSGSDDFVECTNSLSDEKRRQMGDVELVLRFFAFHVHFDGFRHDVGPFLTEFMERVTDTEADEHLEFDYSAQEDTFMHTFSVLKQALGEDTCKRWMGSKFGGGFSNHHFEAFSLGLAKVVDSIDLTNEVQIGRVCDALHNVKKDPAFQVLTTGGGKNSPGPYRDKIRFVENRIRSAL